MAKKNVNNKIKEVLKKPKNVYIAQRHNANLLFLKIRDKGLVKQYTDELATLKAKLNRNINTKAAIVVHLFYTDSWGYFSEKLKLLDKASFDLFVTLPKHNTEFTDEIYKSFPNAHVIIVPNKGRDVLPFIKIIPIIKNAGYKYVLKIHSKKSKHRKDGAEWLSDMVEKLIPNDAGARNAIINNLQKEDTGIIGPSKHYLSFAVNYRQNWNHTKNILNRIYDKKQTAFVKKNYLDYGFFAGTMFWARVDALDQIIKQEFDVGNFEKEKGQIDCTFAHALERVFCIVPEIENLKLYETDSRKVYEITYKTKNVPKWSRVKKLTSVNK